MRMQYMEAKVLGLSSGISMDPLSGAATSHPVALAPNNCAEPVQPSAALGMTNASVGENLIPENTAPMTVLPSGELGMATASGVDCLLSEDTAPSVFDELELLDFDSISL